MSRLAAVRPADATSTQKEAIDAIAGGDRGRDRPLDSLLDEFVTLAGYYTLVSFTLNSFEVPLPGGEPNAFSDR